MPWASRPFRIVWPSATSLGTSRFLAVPNTSYSPHIHQPQLKSDESPLNTGTPDQKLGLIQHYMSFFLLETALPYNHGSEQGGFRKTTIPFWVPKASLSIRGSALFGRHLCCSICQDMSHAKEGQAKGGAPLSSSKFQSGIGSK